MRDIKTAEEQVTAEQLEALVQAIRNIPEDARTYAVRFASINVEDSAADFYDKWAEDVAGRSEAAKKEAFRRERVYQEMLEILPADQRETVAKIVGIEALVAVSDPGAEATQV